MYSFRPSEEQQILIDSVKKFAIKELRSSYRQADEEARPASGWTSAGWELGLLPASIPEEYGGFGARSALTGVLAAEELGWGDVSGGMALTSPNLIALPLLLCGNEAQRASLLPKFTADSFEFGSAALMEPRFDFDPYRLETVAAGCEDRFLLTGVKCNVPYAAESGWMLIYAALDRCTQAFLVPADSPGLKIGGREQNMGMKAYPLYEVELEGCSVPRANRLGGDAGCNFECLINSSRVAQSAFALGLARAAYEYGLEYAKNRQAFGEAIGQRQSIAFMLAEMATDLEAARMMVWEAAWLLDQGKDATKAAYLAKNFVDDMVLMVTDRAVQILGGHGYIRDYPVELWLRNARGFAVMEGISMV
jgi:alkylation response protein AidB-like acyl-CoA dehydrogenase